MEPPPVHDALDVRCPRCGARNRAADEDFVACTHCGAGVPVAADVRFYVRSLQVVENAARWRAERIAQLRALREGRPLPEAPVPYAPLPEARVEASCPSCGFVMRHGEEPVVRCPKCGDETVPAKPAAVRALVTAAFSDKRMSFDELNAEIERAFPVAKPSGDGWTCGACGDAIERVGTDALGGPELAPCPRCGLLSTGGRAQSMARAYARIDAALRAREERAALGEVDAMLSAARRVPADPVNASVPPQPPPRRSLAGTILAVVAVAVVAYFYAAGRSERAAERLRRDVLPLPVVQLPVVPLAVPTTYPDAALADAGGR
jgi:hypothetical protein